jgi:hypothetical protein
MTKRHWDLRGMSLAEVMAVSALALDMRCRDHGATEDEIESARELQRQMLEKQRDESLAKCILSR